MGARTDETPPPDPATPIETLRRHVPGEWLDYNGHMNEARYLQAFSDASDRFMEMIGADGAYIASGRSYFTVESHLRHLGEARAGDEIRVLTQCLAAAGKRMHLFHFLYRGDDLIATGEHMLIHVSLGSRRACDPAPEVLARLERIAAAHAALPLPEGAGRAVGQKP